MRGLRILLRSVLIILLLGMLAGAGIAALIRTERGSELLVRAASRLEPRLALRGLDGTLGTAHFDAIAWIDGDSSVTLESVDWKIDPWCLITWRLCVAQLGVSSLTLGATQAQSSTGRFALPPPLLALGADIDQLHIGRIDIEGGRSITALDFAGNKLGSRIGIDHLHLDIDGVHVALIGRVDLRAQLPLKLSGTLARKGWPGISLSASGDLEQLSLKARSDGDYPLHATADVALLARPVTLAAELRSAGTLPFSLSKVEEGSVQNLLLRLKGSTDALNAVATADIASALFGANHLELNADWTPGALQLRRLESTGEAGTMSSSGRIGTEAPFAWQANTTLSNFCARAWQPEFDCAWSGEATLKGTLNAPSVDIQTALDGRINQYPATLNARVQGDGTAWRIDQFSLLSGDNRLQIQGHIDEALSLDATLLLHSLGDTLQGSSGAGTASLHLGGTRSAPELHAKAEFERLLIGRYATRKLQLDADWTGADSGDNRLLLALRDARIAKFSLKRFNTALSGDRLRQHLTIAASTDLGSLNLDCAGVLSQGKDRDGNCKEFNLESASGTHWSTPQEIALAWRHADKRLRIDAFCLNTGLSSLCSTQPLLIGRDSLQDMRIAGAGLPAEWLAGWLPEDLRAAGEFALEFHADKAEGGRADIDASLSAETLRLAALTAGEELPLVLSALQARLQSTAEGAHFSATLGVGDKGAADAEVQLENSQPEALLNGRVALHDIDLAAIGLSFPGVVAASGTLDGSIDISGALSAPQIAGGLRVTRGKLAHEVLLQSIDDYELGVSFSGPQADIAGRFHSAAGDGTLSGSVLWRDNDWSASLRLQAEALMLEPLRGSELKLVPDIQLALDSHHAALSGEIGVPSANILLDQLPENAVAVSPDTVVLGAMEPASAFDYTLDMKLRIGDAVRLRGYGGDMRLGGTLKLSKKVGEPLLGRGRLRIREGQYGAYGKHLVIRDSSLLFKGPLSHPELFITAVRPLEEQGVEVGLNITGDAQSPEVAIFSRPAMDQQRAMHYLLTGRAPTADGQSDFAVAGALMQLGTAGSRRNTGDLLRGIGISDFSIGTERATRGDLSGTEVHLSGYLSPDLYVRYGISTFDRVNTFRLRYRLRKSLYLEAIAGLESAVDLLYSFER